EFRDGGGGAGYVHARGDGGQQVGERSAAVLGHGRGVRGEGLGVGPPAGGGRGARGRRGLRGVRHQRVWSAVASESVCAKVRVWRIVCGPSPVLLSRRLRLFVVELFV